MKHALLIVAVAALWGCSQKPPELPALLRLESYAFDPASPLEERIGEMPQALLEHYRADDKRPGYASYRLSPAEQALFSEYLALLPPVYGRVLRERCVGIYFLDGLIGNGITNWLAGPDGKVYFHITLNPAGFGKTISETLTERERSCFRPRTGWDLAVDAGDKYKGLLYTLLHEATHGVDYAAGISPRTDDTMPPYYWPDEPVANLFFYKRWEDYSVPLKKYDFPGRAKVTFYGLGGGPLLDMDEALGVYQGLVNGGFISVYASRSWSESLADMATFAILTGRLGQPYDIRLKTPGQTYRIQPMIQSSGLLASEALGYVEKAR